MPADCQFLRILCGEVLRGELGSEQQYGSA
jgi:hypothetical protein